jgi:hypothetical protein
MMLKDALPLDDAVILAKLEALYRLGEEYTPQGEEDRFFSSSSLVWVKTPPGYRLSLGPSGVLAVYPSPSDWSVYLCDKSNVSKLCSQEPIHKARGIAEKYARRYASFSLISRSANWRKMPASSAQKDFLSRLGVSFFTDLSKGEAEALITRYKPLPHTLPVPSIQNKLTA